jgi:hypothetical protein
MMWEVKLIELSPGTLEMICGGVSSFTPPCGATIFAHEPASKDIDK